MLDTNSFLLKVKLRHLFVGEAVALKDPKPDSNDPTKESKKYVEFDLSIWNGAIEPTHPKSDLKLVDCKVGIELEAKQSNRYYDLQKIKKAFSYSETLQEIFLYNYTKNNWIRFSRKDGVITRQNDCHLSESLDLDMVKFVDNETYEKCLDLCANIL